MSLPGSKSLTSRELVLAALAEGPSVIRRALRSRDTELMAKALAALGATVDTTGDDWTVQPGQLAGEVDIDCGLAGTVMRFVPPAAALADGPVAFDGDERARERPLATVLDALRALGARVEGDSLPFTLHGTGGLPGGDVVIDASASSQFVSGLLLSGARYDKGVTVHHRDITGKPVPSLPHIEMTVAMLREAGVEVDDEGDGIPPSDREKIFGRFWHGPSNASTGLGLYVVRGLVEAHGGSVVVTDSDGGGARFVVALPAGLPSVVES